MENVDPSWKKIRKTWRNTQKQKKKKSQQVFAKTSYELLKIFCSGKGTSFRERDYNAFVVSVSCCNFDRKMILKSFWNTDLKT
jgi:hypothetical protein